MSIDDIKPDEWNGMADKWLGSKPGSIIRTTSDGSTADYYQLPENATQLQDLISYKNLNAQIGEIFRECYRYGQASHSDEMRGIKKILFYAQAELERLEKYAKK